MSPASVQPPVRSGRGRGLLGLLPLLLLIGAVFVPDAAPAAVVLQGVRSPPAVDPPRVPALWMPVAGAVVRGFDARAGPYGPGHRGIDIAAAVGATVRAPAAGTLRFAGPVARTTWVTLAVAPRVLVTLGPILDPATGDPATGDPATRSAGRDPVVASGQVRSARVPSGARIGRVGPGHGTAPGEQGEPGTAVTLHLSVRVDGVYVDPLAYLVDRPRARLAPLPTPGGLPGP